MEKNEEVMLKTKLQNNQISESISATGFLIHQTDFIRKLTISHTG